MFCEGAKSERHPCQHRKIDGFRWAKHNFHSELQMKRKAWRVMVLATSKSSKAGIDFITRTTPRSKPWHLRSGIFRVFPCLSNLFLGITWWWWIILHVWQIWQGVRNTRQSTVGSVKWEAMDDHSVQLRSCLNRWYICAELRSTSQKESRIASNNAISGEQIIRLSSWTETSENHELIILRLSS